MVKLSDAEHIQNDNRTEIQTRKFAVQVDEKEMTEAERFQHGEINCGSVADCHRSQTHFRKVIEAGTIDLPLPMHWNAAALRWRMSGNGWLGDLCRRLRFRRVGDGSFKDVVGP